jgi:DNA-binding XRE family transcriptional regulator
MPAKPSRQTPKARKHATGAEKLRALRRAAGLSPEALGRQAGVSGWWIRVIEKDKHEPTLETQRRLARPFGLLPSDVWEPRGGTGLDPSEVARLREFLAKAAA